MARTFGVKAVARENNFIQRNERANPLSNQRDLIYSVNSILESDELREPDLRLDREEVIDIDVQMPASEVATGNQIDQPTNPISATITDPMKPTDKGDDYYRKAIDRYNKAQDDKEKTRDLKIALEVMETATGLVDSYFKHKSIVTQNNYNIMQANRQIMSVKNQAAFAALREQTQSAARKDNAKLDAVARGQSSTGDVAGIAENNEEMYLAQNLMSIEISATRAILGLEHDIIQYQASSEISEYQRNASMANDLATGAIRIGAT